MTRLSLKARTSSQYEQMSGWPEYVSYEKQQMYCTALFGFPIDKKFRSSWSLGLSLADYVQYSPALEGQLWNINKFAFVTVFKTLLVFQNQLWCYGNMAENHWSVLWVGFFFHGMLMSLFPRMQQLSRLLWLRLHITVQSGLETKIASTGVITEGFYE